MLLWKNFQEKKLVIKGINAVGKEPIQCFGSDEKLGWENKESNLIINLNDSFIDNLQSSSVYVLKIPVLPYLDKPKVQISIKDKIAKVAITSYYQENSYLYEIKDFRNGNVIGEYKNPFKVTEPGILHVQVLNENFLTSEPVILPINILEAENGLIRKTYLGLGKLLTNGKSKFLKKKMLYIILKLILIIKIILVMFFLGIYQSKILACMSLELSLMMGQDCLLDLN